MNIQSRYSPGYIDQVFAIWHLKGKPSATRLHDMIPINIDLNEKPGVQTLRNWMQYDEWIERTEELDREIRNQIQKEQVGATVEMLERHAKLGREMQDIARTWIVDHKDELGPGSAVRLLIEGVNMEQATKSIPDLLMKLRDMDDDKLLENIEKMMLEAPAEIDDN